jgi:hypothetical protein
VADNEEREHGDERGVRETGEQRRRAEKVSSVLADHREEIEEDEQRDENAEGRQFEREALDAEQDDRGQDQAVGHPHLPGVDYLHARIFSGNASCERASMRRVKFQDS